MGRIQTRTRRLMGVSTVLHIVFFLLLMLTQKFIPDEEGITEIMWIEPEKSEPAALPLVAKATPEPDEVREPVQRPSLRRSEDKFQRETQKADLVPVVQQPYEIEDRISERLATLQKTKPQKRVNVAALKVSNPVGRPTLAGVSDVERPDQTPTELTRQKKVKPNPIALRRTRPRTMEAATIPTQIPDTPARPKRAETQESTASRQLAGATLTGPVADRPLITYNKPAYPEWAKQEAVEGSVTIYFVVLPSGEVKENVLIQKTSGFGDFDENASEAILSWRFEPLGTGVTGEQWGTITFHYRLSDS